MDDLFIPLSDPDPDVLIDRVMFAAQILDRVATAFGFTIQYGPGNAEACIILCGHGKALAQRILQSYEQGERIPHLPIDGTKTLRVVGGYRHLGALATTSLPLFHRTCQPVRRKHKLSKGHC